MNYYLDTSVVVALVLRDFHTARAEAWLEHAAPACIVSDFCAIEFASVVSRQVRMSHLSPADGNAVLKVFDEWIARTTQVVTSSGEHMEAAGRMVRSITGWCWRPSMNVSATPRAGKTSRSSCPNREKLMGKVKSGKRITPPITSTGARLSACAFQT
jgi:uncharacterized protein with PIN domain